MKFIKEYLKEVLHIQPLGTVTIEATNDINGTFLSGEEIIIDGFSSGLYVAHIDYANWLEKKLNGTNKIEQVSKITNDTQNYIDLGLPSGKLWAKCNIGAEKETEYGKYFQWGDVVGYEGDEAKAHSTIRTCPFYYGSTEVKDLLFEICPNGVLTPQYDAVYQATKGKAHMPTKEDFKELIANTNSSWEEDFNGSGVDGRKFTSKKDASQYIFIPASGYARHGSFDGRGRYGNIWSSSIVSSNLCNAWELVSKSVYVDIFHIDCFCGFPVRGVMN